MILPDKNIRLEFSLLNCGAIILQTINKPQTISFLWDRVRDSIAFASYDKFLLTLDYLFMVNAISLKNGLIARCKDDSFCKE